MNIYVAENFITVPGAWKTIGGRKQLVPASDSFKHINCWDTQAANKKQALVLIAQSIAKTYKWDYACLLDITLTEGI